MGRKKRSGNFQRKEDTREPRKTLSNIDKITFSFKDIDFTQPKGNQQNFELWQEIGLLSALGIKMKEVSQLTFNEARGSGGNGHLKEYPEFPSNAQTEFTYPKHVDENARWAVLNNIGGQKPRVVGYIDGSTFYVVFLDKDHQFWSSKKKHT